MALNLLNGELKRSTFLNAVIGGADIPDWLIYAVAGVCTVIVLILLLVLVVYCMKRRKRHEDDDTSSKQKLDPPSMRAPQWMMTADGFSPSIDGHATQQSFVQVDSASSTNADCPHVILNASCENGPVRVRNERNYLPFDGDFVRESDLLNQCDSCGANLMQQEAYSHSQPLAGQFDLRTSLNPLSGHDRFSTFSPTGNNSLHSFAAHEPNANWTVPRKIVYEVVV